MSSEEEDQNIEDEHSSLQSLLTLPLFSCHSALPPSPEHPGMSTPPLYTTSASVPFTWEEEPGKPRPSSSPPPPPNPSNILELPPGLARTPSPTTVLDGPYINSATPNFMSSSFRFLSQEGGESEKKKLRRKTSFFSTWRHKNLKNGKNDYVGNSSRSFVFPSSCEADSGFGFRFDEPASDKNGNFSRISRNESVHSLSPKPQFWASVYQGFKHAIPWKTSRKSRKDVLL